jgi:outer membrane protein assembly factor BamB
MKFFLLLFFSSFCWAESFSTLKILPTKPALMGEVAPRESTAPIIIGDILFYANQTGHVQAIHRLYEYTFWENPIKMPGRIEGSLTYGRSKIFVGDTFGNLQAFHSNDGTPSWQAPIQIKGEWLSAGTLHKDKFYIQSSDDKVYCYSENGKEEWVYSESGDEKMKIRGKAKPTYYKGALYLGFSNGYFVALNAETGKALWRQKLKTKSRFYDITLSPLVDDELVIVASYDGNLYFLDRNNGKVVWQFKTGSYSGFLNDGDQIYFSALDNHIYSINKKTRTITWKTPTAKGVGLIPVKINDKLIVPTTGDPVYLLDQKTGKVLSTTFLGTGTLANAAQHVDGLFYILSNYGNLFTFQVASK